MASGGALCGYSTTRKSALSLALRDFWVELVDLFPFHTIFLFTHTFYVPTKLSEKLKVLHLLHLRLSKSALTLCFSLVEQGGFTPLIRHQTHLRLTGIRLHHSRKPKRTAPLLRASDRSLCSTCSRFLQPSGRQRLRRDKPKAPRGTPSRF